MRKLKTISMLFFLLFFVSNPLKASLDFVKLENGFSPFPIKILKQIFNTLENFSKGPESFLNDTTSHFQKSEFLVALSINKIHSSFQDNNLKVLDDYLRICEDISDDGREVFGILQKNKEAIENEGWRRWFFDRYMQHKKLTKDAILSGVFYPWPFMYEQGQTHFSDLNQSMRLGILISAYHGNDEATRIILASTHKADEMAPKVWKHYFGFLYEKKSFFSVNFESNRLDSVKGFLDVPFSFNNLKLLEKLRIVDLNGLKDLGGMSSLNLAFLMKEQKHFDIALGLFTKAGSEGYLRGYIEAGFLFLEDEHKEDEESFKEAEESFKKAGAYGLWKIAECYRYGRRISRNLMEANRYYKLAVTHVSSSAEIFYDCADFCEQIALSQDSSEVKKMIWCQVKEYLLQSGNLGMGVGYKKAAQLMHQGFIQDSSQEEMINLYKKAYDLGSTDFVLENLQSLGVIVENDEFLREKNEKNRKCKELSEIFLKQILRE